ncbi:MAG: hypothetical protein JO250_06765 [Armatimonadetes bacterium]|nr:hypothetical protein [Armatimonadota bacterium]
MSSEKNGAEAGDTQPPSPRPLTTRSLTAAADPGRRLRELLREQENGDQAEPNAAAAAPAAREQPAPPPPTAFVRPEPPAAPPPDPTPAIPSPTPAAPATPVETVRLFVMLDGARMDPVEYPGREALPTRAQLEQTHRAYVLRDQWSRTDSTPTWIVHMKRKTR